MRLAEHRSGMPSSALGLDIGGANLKAAHSDGGARLQSFPLWKQPEKLTEALHVFKDGLPSCGFLAITMTGELCDCFESKRHGVSAILDAVEAIAKGVPVGVWSTEGTFLHLQAARSAPLRVAAANWHALATFAGRLAPSGPALLLDVGSTTTDIIPLLDGRPVPVGLTDPERLRSNELVYTGVRRTPVCALLGVEGAAELFATTQDVYTVLGLVPEEPSSFDTADGQPASRVAACRRLARMVCADLETLSVAECEELARRLMRRQVSHISASAQRVARRLPSPPKTVIVAGSGEFLAERVVAENEELASCRLVSFSGQFGADRSSAACAYALTVLATERSHAV